MGLISSYKALKIILNEIEDFGSEEIHFLDSLGRVLKDMGKSDEALSFFQRAIETQLRGPA